MQIRNSFSTTLLVFFALIESGSASVYASGSSDLVGILASITEPGNAAELGLTQDQLDRLEALIKQHESQALTFSSQIRQLPSAEQKSKKADNLRLIERQGLALLTDSQRSKAEMWRLQKLGPAALVEPEVAGLMGISDEQISKIKNILEGKSILDREMGKAKAAVELNTRIVAALDASQKIAWQTLVGKAEKSEAASENADAAKSPSDVVVQAQANMAGPADGYAINFNAAPWSEVLKWLAKEAELSLQADLYPQGTFSYRDPFRRYSLSETMDVMNSVLLGKGYTLMKKQRVLMTVDLGGDNAELTRAFVRELAESVSIEELAKRGDFEIVKCVFTLERSTVEEIEKEVRLLMGPQGSVVSLPTAGQVLVCETGSKLRIIRDLIERSEKPDGARSAKIVTLPLKHVSADEVLASYSVTLGPSDEQNAYTAGLEAIAMALRCVPLGLHDRDLTIVTSNRSVLQVIRRPRQQSGQCTIREIYGAVEFLGRRGCRVRLRWVPAKNEKFTLGPLAKRQAKRATRDECSAEPATFQARSTTLRLLLNEHAGAGQIPERVGKYSKRIDKALPGKHTRKLYDELTRKESEVLVQLRTGKSRLNSYLRKIGAVESDECTCGQSAETVEHFLFRCRRWTVQREIMLRYARGKMGDLSFFLGGKAESDDDKWQPDMGAVRATIQFALATKRFRMDRERDM